MLFDSSADHVRGHLTLRRRTCPAAGAALLEPVLVPLGGGDVRVLGIYLGSGSRATLGLSTGFHLHGNGDHQASTTGPEHIAMFVCIVPPATVCAGELICGVAANVKAPPVIKNSRRSIMPPPCLRLQRRGCQSSSGTACWYAVAAWEFGTERIMTHTFAASFLVLLTDSGTTSAFRHP